MNAALEDRLRRHYDDRTRDIPAQGQGLDDGHKLKISPLKPAARPNRTARTVLVAGSIAAVIVFGLVVVNRPTPTPEAAGVGSPESISSDGSVADSPPQPQPLEPLVPAETLPPSADVSDSPRPAPVTVAGSAPSVWYRLQPDLDVSWYQEADGESPAMLCWRTPVGSECVKDKGALPLIVPTAGNQTLVVVWVETLIGDNLDVQLAGGGVLSARFELDATLGWGVARYLLPDGARISAVGTASGSASEIVEVSGQTLPPTVGLIETPLTIPAGSELNYWRWFADLDISQRATTSGGTELCWRTPVGTGCVEDSFNSPEVGIIPTDGGVILLARRALVEITPPPTDPSAPKFEEGLPLHSITVMLSDGSTATVVVDEGAAFGIGYARLALAPGVTVVSATST